MWFWIESLAPKLLKVLLHRTWEHMKIASNDVKKEGKPPTYEKVMEQNSAWNRFAMALLGWYGHFPFGGGGVFFLSSLFFFKGRGLN